MQVFILVTADVPDQAAAHKLRTEVIGAMDDARDAGWISDGATFTVSEVQPLWPLADPGGGA